MGGHASSRHRSGWRRAACCAWERPRAGSGRTSRSRAASRCRRCSARGRPTRSVTSDPGRWRWGTGSSVGQSARAARGGLDTPRPPVPGPLHITAGPRADRVDGDVVDLLCRTAYVVSPSSDRIGMRLEGEPLPLRASEELPSEGMVLGAVQVPPDGLPVVFLADHPTTGGYPVVAVVDESDLWQCGAAAAGRAGQRSPGATDGQRPVSRLGASAPRRSRARPRACRRSRRSAPWSPSAPRRRC